MSQSNKLTPGGLKAREHLRSMFESQRQKTPVTFAVSGRLLEIVGKSVDSDLEEAQVLFSSGDYRASLEAFGRARSKASELVASGDGTAALSLAAASVGAGFAHLNLQEMEQAHEMFLEARTDDLDYRSRSSLSIGLLEVGDAEQARDLLPVRDSEEPFVARRDEAAQLLEIAGGIIPLELAESSHVLLRAAERSNNEGNVASGASYAQRGLALLATENRPALRVLHLRILLESIWRTVFEQDVNDGGVLREVRAELLSQVSAELSSLNAGELVPDLHDQLYQARTGLLVLVADWQALNRLEQRDGVVSTGNDEQFQVAIDFARAGELPRALEAVVDTGHPWRTELLRVDLLSLGGETAEATERVLRLCREFPNRAPIEYVAAKLLLGAGEYSKALERAEQAFRELPGRGYIVLLAQCQASVGDWAGVLRTLKPISQDDEVDVLQLLATAADHTGDADAIQYWRRHSRLGGAAPGSRVRLGLALARFGQDESAARLSAETLRDFGEVLSLQELFACGQLQLNKFGSDVAVSRTAELLRGRFPDSDDAEYYRLILLSGKGFPDGNQAIDYSRLEAAGHLRSVSLDDVVELVGEQRTLSEAAHGLYERGWLPFESYCRLSHSRAAELVEGISEASRHSSIRLRTPIALRGGQPPLALEGRMLLVSDLELLVVERVGLMSAIRSALGPDGRICLYREVWERIVGDRRYLEHGAQRAEYFRSEALLALIGADGRVRVEESQENDRHAATERDITWVVREPDEDELGSVLVGSMIEYWEASGGLTEAQVTAALRVLGLQRDSSLKIESVPSDIWLEPGLLELLFRGNMIEPLLDCLGGEVWLGREAVSQLRRHHRELRQRGRAADQANQLHATLGEGLRDGWAVLIEERPTEIGLPGLREGVPESYEQFVVRPIQDAMSYRESLVQNPEWIRLAADFVGTDGIGAPEQLMKLAWESPESFRAFTARYRQVVDREVTLPEMVRSLLPPQEQQAILVNLARLGFHDALTSKEILALGDAYGGLDGDIPDAVLSKIEATGCDLSDRWADLARLKLASVYSEAIWQGFFLDSEASIRDGTLTCRTLLERAENVDSKVSSRLLEQVLGYLSVLAIERPMLSFLSKDGDTYVPSTDAPVAAMWRCIRDWSEGSISRLAACKRAVSFGWIVLDEYSSSGPSGEASWLPLSVCSDILFASHVIIDPVPHPNATVGILSCLWKQRPLTARSFGVKQGEHECSLTLESVLQFVADHIGNVQMHGDDSLSCDYVSEDGKIRLKVVVPAEAALLRAKPDVIAGLATDLSSIQGPHDGRAARLLLDLASDPENVEARRRVARAACVSPFKLIRDNPEYILTWGTRATGDGASYPSTLVELRELLSEPVTGLGSKRVADCLFDRVSTEGVWGGREDKQGLFELAIQLPGAASSLGATIFAKAAGAEEWDGLWRALAAPEDCSVGMLARSAGLLAAASAIGEASVRDKNAAMLAELISRIVSPTKTETALASLEPRVLQSVEHCVRRVVEPAPISRPELIWLTHRLYEWLVVQVDRRGSDDDFSWQALAPEVSNSPDPSAWRRGRLAAVLHAVLDVVEQLALTTKDLGSLPVVLECLIEVAAWESTDDAFEHSDLTDWRRSKRCERLAGDIALWIAPESYFDLPPQWRLRVLEELPKSGHDETAVGLSVTPIVRAIALRLADLSAPEKNAFLRWLAAVGDSEAAFLWKWVCYGELYRLGSEEHGEELRSLILENWTSKTIDRAVAVLLIASAGLGGLEVAQAEFQRLLGHGESKQEYGWLADGLVALANWETAVPQEATELLNWVCGLPELNEIAAFKIIADLDTAS